MAIKTKHLKNFKHESKKKKVQEKIDKLTNEIKEKNTALAQVTEQLSKSDLSSGQQESDKKEVSAVSQSKELKELKSENKKLLSQIE